MFGIEEPDISRTYGWSMPFLCYSSFLVFFYLPNRLAKISIMKMFNVLLQLVIIYFIMLAISKPRHMVINTALNLKIKFLDCFDDITRPD